MFKLSDSEMNMSCCIIIKETVEIKEVISSTVGFSLHCKIDLFQNVSIDKGVKTASSLVSSFYAR